MGPWIGLYNPLLHRCFRRLNALSRDGVLRVTWAGRKRHAACGIVDVRPDRTAEYAILDSWSCPAAAGRSRRRRSPGSSAGRLICARFASRYAKGSVSRDLRALESADRRRRAGVLNASLVCRRPVGQRSPVFTTAVLGFFRRRPSASRPSRRGARSQGHGRGAAPLLPDVVRGLLDPSFGNLPSRRVSVIPTGGRRQTRCEAHRWFILRMSAKSLFGNIFVGGCNPLDKCNTGLLGLSASVMPDPTRQPGPDWGGSLASSSLGFAPPRASPR